MSEAGVLPEQGKEVINTLENHPLFQKAQRVLLFHSLPDEVNTHSLISRYRGIKTILLPSVVGDHLELHEYVNESATSVGAYHIVESQGRLVPASEYANIDLAIIPGVAFDKEGNRLGRGKGYYDRLLPLLHCHTIGLCYPFQIVDTVPHEPHDMKVDEVITITYLQL